jgi:hypothetical protein
MNFGFRLRRKAPVPEVFEEFATRSRTRIRLYSWAATTELTNKKPNGNEDDERREEERGQKTCQ